ncbi:MAG TPA: SEC-C metal-binding domain-containing protein [Acidimicrobiia bacterium]|nr:SEC-C metal-binding domain-containing protein [Acidimicrobiia bacterium]
MVGDGGLAESIVGVLGTGVLDRDAITDALVARGVVSGSRSSVRGRIDRFLQFDTRFADVAGGTIFVPAVVEGTTWTVWVDPGDAADGFVRMHPWLAPLGWWLVAGGVDLVDRSGTVLGRLETDGLWLDDRDTDVVFGSDGWLDDLAGGWASVAVVGGGLCWSPCSVAPSPSERQTAALRVGFGRAVRFERETLRDREPTTLVFSSGDGPLHEALVADRDAFIGDPVAPLPDLYRSAGLVERSGIVAAEGFDWDALRAWQDRNRLGVIYQLGADQVERLAALLDAVLASPNEGSASSRVDDRELATALDDGAVAAAFWRERATREIPLENVRALAAALDARAGGVPHVGVRWLQARCADWSGDAATAVALLSEVDASCPHLPARLDAAGFASDRGDAATACLLLREYADIDDPPDDTEGDGSRSDAASLKEEVATFALRRPRPAARRNDPCPCGSGRKYKACHLGTQQHTLADRASWLYDKAVRFLRSRHPRSVRSLAAAMAEPSESATLYDELVDAPFLADVALHEDGVFAEFVAARSALLPDDEALLAAQWALVDRGVFEIQRVDRDRLVLHDIGHGESITVVNTHRDRHARPGTLVAGRPLPVGDTYRAFSGFIEVPRAAATELVEVIDGGDADDLVAFLGDLLRPTRLTNADGHDLELHTLRWSIGDPSTVERALRDAGYERADDQSVWHLTQRSSVGDRTVVARVEVAGDELIGEVNSRERAAALKAAIAAVIPDATLIDDAARSLTDALADHEPDSSTAAPVRADDPALRDALAAFIADQERRWLDEPIPALGGRTPREAADDPVGREELAHLLDEFPDPDDPDVAVMNPRRLRAALGL